MLTRRWTLCLVGTALLAATTGAQGRGQPALADDAATLTVNGVRFRDLNRSGTLEPYEDWRLASAVRAADLVRRMTLDEKAGAAVHGTAPAPGNPMGLGAIYDTTAAARIILTRNVTSLITRLSARPAQFAAANNALQQIAARGRLGIPLTISTDPRNHFQAITGASVDPSGFSQWPETLGFGALDDPAAVERFARIVRDEYRAVGIHMALSPQADLATEPRWSRITGTFGERPARVGALVTAYTIGMQGSPAGLTRGGVATIVKHWVGYGASVDGFDGHNAYGRFADFTSGSLRDHITPFLGAIRAGVVGVMPTYDILQGVTLNGAPLEAVGAGFNAQLLRDALRGTYRFRGMVLSDWAITQDCVDACLTGTPQQMPWQIAMPWGVESLTRTQRFAKGMNAGIDQFGGVDDGQPFVDAVNAGTVTVARLDTAVMRVMIVKFDLGLFEQPFVDTARAAQVIGTPSIQREALQTQARALVVLKNSRGAQLLGGAGQKVFVRGVDTALVRSRGFTVVSRATDADVAVIRMAAPWQTLHPTFFFGSFQHEGDLDYKDADSTLALVRSVSATTPTIVVVYLDRPAILTPLVPLSAALIGEFGVSDAALLDALTGVVRPVGRLPFELPRSMEAVRAQKAALPHDSPAPLFPVGFRALP
jgi:beta-glucosidase